MNRYLKNQKTGLYFSKEGMWDNWSNARLFEDVEVMIRTAFQIDQDDLEIVITFSSHEPTGSDIALPLPRRATIAFTRACANAEPAGAGGTKGF